MIRPQQRLRKFTRDPNYAARLGRRQITERSLQIIATIERYRLLPTSLLLKLVAGDPRNVYSHLQQLYHRGLVNRFCFFGTTGRPQEFNYFLDNQQALELLIEEAGADPDSVDFKRVRRNREKWSPLLEKAPTAADAGTADTPADQSAEGPSEGQRLFLKHELMVSRFHGMLELAARASAGRVKLVEWYQGPILHHQIEAPKIVYRGDGWHLQEDSERIPHRPDALFTLQKTGSPEPLHFFYEADRKTTSLKRMIKKFRSHFHYITKTRQHREDYSILRIRAVLTETLDTRWAEALRTAAQHPIVSGKPSPLFWFTASDILTRPVDVTEGGGTRQIPLYLLRPDIILDRIWATPVDDTVFQLLD
jgi:protein involved in plasmid replication-relaxation